MDDLTILIGSFKGAIYVLKNIVNCELKDFNRFTNDEIPHETSRQEYNNSYTAALTHLKNGGSKKIVLSRIKKLNGKFNPITLFEKLNSKYKSTYNYLLSSPTLGTWIGASPELLCSFKSDKLKTVALAGTKTKGENWTKKELIEQKYVSDYIQSVLLDLVEKIAVSTVKDEEAGPVVHLKTDIRAKIKSEDWKTIVEALHPTPAVCGIPTNTVAEIIEKIEIHKRMLYAGFIGILNKNEKVFFVNLRCMQIRNNATYLYLGGGLTIDSDLEREWNETERKAKTLMAILDL